MAMTVHCDIVSAEREIFSGLVEFVSATGSLGDLGVFPGHTPLLTELKPGPVELRKQGGEQEIIYVSGGFLEVQPTHVSVLADTVLRADELSEAEAEAAKAEAQQHMSEAKSDQFEYDRAATQLAKAVGQIRTLQEIRRKLK